jgi:diguanylate cyclase (GGDEF)-like protein/PAS domain S-box-containing protein
MSKPCSNPESPNGRGPSRTLHNVQRLARVFEHSGGGIALQSPDGVWEEVNPAFCAMLGYSRNELVGRSFTEITHPDDIEPSLEQLRRLNDKEIDSLNFDKRYLHATGHEVWVRLDVSMVLDSAERPELIIIQAHEITTSRQVREQLAENEARLDSVIRSMAEGLIVVDPDGRFSVANQRAAEILGAVPQALESLSLEDFDSDCWRLDGTPMTSEEFPASVTLATGHPQREVVMGLERPDGRQVWIEISTEPVYKDESERIQAVVATFSDITQRIETEHALRESQERLSLAIEGAKLGMWDWNLEAHDLSFNKIAARILGYRENEIASDVSSVRALTHPEDDAHLVDEMEAHLAGTRPFFEADVRMRRKSGGYIWTNMRGRVTERDSRDKPLRVTGMLMDISRRKELEAELERLATTDELTGLFNRRYGIDAVKNEIARAQRSGRPLSLILLDIDHFKGVNDRFGHDVGDKVLGDLAGLLRERLRRTDTAARWGGEEFAVILPETDCADGRRFAGELLARMEEIKTPDGEGISASFGVVDYRGDESASELVKRADRLMYRAKQAGRARVEV